MPVKGQEPGAAVLAADPPAAALGHEAVTKRPWRQRLASSGDRAVAYRWSDV